MENNRKFMYTICKCGRYLSLETWKFPNGVLRRIIKYKTDKEQVNTEMCPRCRIGSQP